VYSINSYSIQNSNGKDNNGNKSDEKVTILVKWFMPDVLKEISGICWIDEQRIACIQDELGTIFIYNILNAEIESRIPFGEPGDYESITKSDNTYYVLRADGRIFEIRTSPSKKVSVNQYEIPLDKSLDFEGIFYDKIKKQLLFTFKEADPFTNSNKRGIYVFDPVKKVVGKKPVYEIDLSDSALKKKDDDDEKELYKKFLPSDLAINPIKSDIYITDGVNCSLLILDKAGKLKSYFKLDKDDFPQPEGITFSAKGDLYISTEGVKKSGAISKAIIESVIQIDDKKKD
jgi:uncharacterized protein YjiK